MARDFICPDCNENHGKSTQLAQLVHCNSCGETHFNEDGHEIERPDCNPAGESFESLEQGSRL